MTMKTTAAPAASKKAEVPMTGKLPLEGGKDGITRTLDNKDVLKAPPDPKVKKVAEELATALDKQRKVALEAEDLGQALLKAFDESHKTKKIMVRGEMGTYWFSKQSLSKLKVEKKKANEA
jgi:hypothetical protein